MSFKYQINLKIKFVINTLHIQYVYKYHYLFYYSWSLTCETNQHVIFSLQRVLHILKQHIMDIRMLMILLLHWGMHAYAIIGITQLHQPTFHGALLCLIPFPAIFYLMTVKFTDPEKLDVA